MFLLLAPTDGYWWVIWAATDRSSSFDGSLFTPNIDEATVAINLVLALPVIWPFAMPSVTH